MVYTSYRPTSFDILLRDKFYLMPASNPILADGLKSVPTSIACARAQVIGCGVGNFEYFLDQFKTLASKERLDCGKLQCQM
jgi:hypothetical protein